MSKLTEKGKELAFLLRHDKEYNFDQHGWRTIEDLIVNHEFTNELIEKIVETNDKKRFEYNEDKTMIRARQGHSIDVDVELTEVVPPDVLYHGTSMVNHQLIKEQGLNKMARQHVHLTDCLETAKKVGMRHAHDINNLLVFKVMTKEMYDDGYKFFLSNNGVYLTDNVPYKYLIVE